MRGIVRYNARMADNKHAKVIVGVTGLVLHEERYLMAERADGEWSAGTIGAPGGGCEFAPCDDQYLEDELRREIREEVGIEIDNLRYLYSKMRGEPGESVYVFVYFLCDRTSGEPHPADPDEVASVEWMSAEQIINDPRAMPWTRQAIVKAEEARKQWMLD